MTWSAFQVFLNMTGGSDDGFPAIETTTEKTRKGKAGIEKRLRAGKVLLGG